MIERLKWLRRVLRMKDDKFPKIVHFGQPCKAKQKAEHPRLGWKDSAEKDLRGIQTSWEGLKREALNRLGCRRSVRSRVGLRRHGAAICC